MVVGNLPWGNKVGKLEDGHRIVEHLCITFINAVLCLFVSSNCFTALCTSPSSCEGNMPQWHVKDEAIERFGIEDLDKLRSWTLLWHADTDFATLMVVVPKSWRVVNLKFD